MAKKGYLLSLLAVIIVSLGIFALKGYGKEDRTESKDSRIISEKIEEILKNQKDIVERLKDIRAELDIIKIRASQR